MNSDPALYVAGLKHEHDQVYIENLAYYLRRQGLCLRTIEFENTGQRPELEQCFESGPSAVLGFNSELDHSWIGSQSFVDLARRNNVAVVQWILDHPAARWHEFENSTFANSAFLLNTELAQAYFERYCMPEAVSSVMGGVGPSPRSRVSELCADGFAARSISCLIPLGFMRLGRSPELTMAEIGALAPTLRDAVNSAVASARYDLDTPMETHLERALDLPAAALGDEEFNRCFRLVEESVQAIRRRRIFAVARRHPVLVQSDGLAARHLVGGKAAFAGDVSVCSTLERMKSCRAVLSVSPLPDMIHDRTMNALNAGCVALAEDSEANRAWLRHGETGLLFRYDDDSLDECFDLLCNDSRRSYAIAASGFAIRDIPAFHYGQFCNLMAVVRRQSALMRRAGFAESRRR